MNTCGSSFHIKLASIFDSKGRRLSASPGSTFLHPSVGRWADQNLGGGAHPDRHICSFILQMFHICPWKRWQGSNHRFFPINTHFLCSKTQSYEFSPVTGTGDLWREGW